MYILGTTTIGWIDAAGGNSGSLDLNPPTGFYDGITSRAGTNLLYLLRDTSGDSKIDVFNITTQQITFDFATLPAITNPAAITDGPDGLLYAIGAGFSQPAGYSVVDAVSGTVVYSHNIMDFPGTYRSLTGLLPQPSAVGDEEPVPGLGLKHLAWPNPFNPQVEIRYELAQAGAVRVRILDVRGHLLRVLKDGPATAGWQSLTWDGRDDGGRGLPSGTYLYQISGAGQEAVGKIGLVR